MKLRSWKLAIRTWVSRVPHATDDPTDNIHRRTSPFSADIPDTGRRVVHIQQPKNAFSFYIRSIYSADAIPRFNRCCASQSFKEFMNKNRRLHIRDSTANGSHSAGLSSNSFLTNPAADTNGNFSSKQHNYTNDECTLSLIHI